MIDYSTIIKSNRGHHVQYRNSSKIAPWCFPNTFVSKEHQLPIGTAPILTVDSELRSQQILLLSTKEQPIAIHRYFPKQKIQDDLSLTIRTAETWLRNQLPLWISDRSVLNPIVYCVYSSDPLIPPSKVDGSSAGLSLILVALSEYLQKPLPKNLFSSASIESNGTLGPVKGLEHKLLCLNENCTVNNLQFLCCKQQEQIAQQICLNNRYPITVRGYSTITEMMNEFQIDSEKTFSTILSDRLISKDLATFIESAFYQALEGQSHIYGWKGLIGSVRFLQKEHSDLPKKSLHQLQIIELIATRYTKSESDIFITEKDIIWLQQTPLPTRLPVLAHLVQQCNEIPESLSSRAKELVLNEVQNHLPKHSQDTEEILIAPPYLKLWGAYGRLLASFRKNGQEDIDCKDLFALQQQSFHGWINNAFYEQASYPLCEMLRLSGIINESKYHQEADRAQQRLGLTPNGINANNQPFIQFANLIRMHTCFGEWKKILKSLLESTHFKTPHFLYPMIYKWILDNKLNDEIPHLYSKAQEWFEQTIE
jgi:hypothetical protein